MDCTTQFWLFVVLGIVWMVWIVLTYLIGKQENKMYYNKGVVDGMQRAAERFERVNYISTKKNGTD